MSWGDDRIRPDERDGRGVHPRSATWVHGRRGKRNTGTDGGSYLEMCGDLLLTLWLISGGSSCDSGFKRPAFVPSAKWWVGREAAAPRLVDDSGCVHRLGAALSNCVGSLLILEPRSPAAKRPYVCRCGRLASIAWRDFSKHTGGRRATLIVVSSRYLCPCARRAQARS